MRQFRHLLSCSVLILLCAGAATAQSLITYHVEPQMSDKTFKIRMDVPRVRDLTVRVQMPVWMPGAYFVGNFATNVATIAAADSGQKPLKIFHPDPNTWEIAANGAKAVQVTYTLKGADLEEAAGVPRRGHISGPRTYLYVVGRKTEPAELDIQTPSGAKVWNVATSLDPLPSSDRSAASPPPIHAFRAPTYDVLADAPVEMGDFAEEKFVAGGKPHSVVMYGDYATIDRAKLTDYCKRIAETETSFFGDAPFARYIFQFRTTSAPSRGAGGLEHLGSTEIGTIGQVNDRIRSVIAHEYFHLWNVKRIRPAVLGPFNYVDPPHTANLWWSEGVTSYYGDLLSRRGGLNTRDEYLKHLGDTIGQLVNSPVYGKVSADESSLRVWEANNSQGYGGMSYYTSGELIGLCLDLKIRQATGGRYSLDDVIRSLYLQCRRGEGPGFDEDDIKKTVNRIAGRDLSDFYDTVVRSTEPLPFQECLGYAGLNLARVEPPRVLGDPGMQLSRGRAVGMVTIGEVTPGGPADMAGIKAGDRVTAVSDSTEPREFGRILAGAKPGEKIKITLARGETKTEVELTVGSRSSYQWSVTTNPSASPDQIQLRDHWLGGS